MLRFTRVSSAKTACWRMRVLAEHAWMVCLLAFSVPFQCYGGEPVRPPSVCGDGTFVDLVQAHGPWVDGCPGFSSCRPGFFCAGSVQRPCPGGTFNDKFGSSTCEECPAGSFCPQAWETKPNRQLSGTVRPEPCGGPSVYCPAGAAHPLPVPLGSIGFGSLLEDGSMHTHVQQVKPGFYASQGVQHPCPAGRYGSIPGESSPKCSGECQEGYFCPPGSVSPTQRRCGGFHQFCPRGSGSPSRVSESPQGSVNEGGNSHFSVGTDLQDTLETSQSRTKQVLCPLGHFCVNGVRFPCPAGRFGEREGSSSPDCSGLCEAGFFCPPGSIGPQQLPCASNSERNVVFCPAGSGRPLPVPEGHFSDGGTALTRTMSVPCTAGFFCRDGRAALCPPGRFGQRMGETRQSCQGPCAAGFYCPISGGTSAELVECGYGLEHPASVFCPEGNRQPTKVSPGFFSVRNTPGSSIPVSSEWYASHSFPASATEGLASQSVALQDLIGTWDTEIGTQDGNESKSKYAFDSLVRAAQLLAAHTAAGNGTLLTQGSPQAQDLPAGTVAAVAHVASTHALHGQGTFAFVDSVQGEFELILSLDQSLSTQTAERRCPAGSYCVAGVRRPCPAGRFGSGSGETDPLCSGPCHAGFWCPEGSHTGMAQECGGPSLFCPVGSTQPREVPPGFVGVPTMEPRRQYGIKMCEQGVFCLLGAQAKCAAGRFGSRTGEGNPACSGECAAGFFCPPGSTWNEAEQCGSPSEFCPRGSGRPLPVEVGHYSEGGRTSDSGGYTFPAAPLHCPREGDFGPTGAHDLTGDVSSLYISSDVSRACVSGAMGDWVQRKAQKVCEPGHFCTGGLRFECPPGRFGNHEGVSHPACDGVCEKGFYCPWGSVSPRQSPCGSPSVFCPTGSGAPTRVEKGFYSVPESMSTHHRIGQRRCEPGWFCTGGTRHPCPAGRYGSAHGLATEGCSGACAAGYFCPEGSKTPTAQPCGGSEVYCPIGSSAPLPVPTGTFSIGGDHSGESVPGNATRQAFQVCLPGNFCSKGVMFQCPSGRWGSRKAENSSSCEGACPSGYFCPPGTQSPTAHPCGSLLLPGVDEVQLQETGLKVPSRFLNARQHTSLGHAVSGGFGGSGLSGSQAQQILSMAEELAALTKASQTGLASLTPSEISSVDGSVHDDGEVAGRLQMVQAAFMRGTFNDSLGNYTFTWESGWRVRAPAVTELVGNTTIAGILFENGGASVFCPEGSALPRFAKLGYYTHGSSDPLFRFQTGQRVCPKGSFCVNGKNFPCPAGRHGSREGLATRFCSASCPAGHFCPEGSVEPRQCPAGSYSTGGMPSCSSCPDTHAGLGKAPASVKAGFGSDRGGQGERCKTSRACCGI